MVVDQVAGACLELCPCCSALVLGAYAMAQSCLTTKSDGPNKSVSPNIGPLAQWLQTDDSHKLDWLGRTATNWIGEEGQRSACVVIANTAAAFGHNVMANTAVGFGHNVSCLFDSIRRRTAAQLRCKSERVGLPLDQLPYIGHNYIAIVVCLWISCRP